MRREETEELVVMLVVQIVHTGISPIISKKKLQLPSLFLTANFGCVESRESLLKTRRFELMQIRRISC